MVAEKCYFTNTSTSKGKETPGAATVCSWYLNFDLKFLSMYKRGLIISFLISCNIIASLAQHSDKENELRKITRLALSDVRLDYLKDSTQPFYIYFLTFSVDAESNHPIIQKTCDYPQGSFDISAKKLEKFEAVDVNWNLLVPGLSKQNTIILPIVVSIDPDKQMKKPCFTIDQHIEILRQCFVHVRIGSDIKIMEPLYYFETGFLH